MRVRVLLHRHHAVLPADAVVLLIVGLAGALRPTVGGISASCLPITFVILYMLCSFGQLWSIGQSAYQLVQIAHQVLSQFDEEGLGPSGWAPQYICCGV